MKKHCNISNRQVCDVDIRDRRTKEPILYFETANITTQSISSDLSFAKVKGAKKIHFYNEINGVVEIEAQIYPFKLFSLLNDGQIESDAYYPKRRIIKCTQPGILKVNDDIVPGTLFVFRLGGRNKSEIKGSFKDGEFTASNLLDISVNEYYEVGYILYRQSNVKRLSFSNKGKPNKSYYISLNTVEKNEEGIYIPYKLVLYRAYVQKSFELTQSNTDNPMSIKFSFVLLQDKNNGFMDMVEITDEQYDNLLLNDYVITSDGILTSIKTYKIPTIDSTGVISFNSDPFLTNDGILVLNNI